MMGKYFSDRQAQSGQVILLVVLVMVVALTVGLAAVTRSVTNVRTSTEDENSQRAFSAAEAGIQQALNNGSSVTFTGNQTRAAATTTTLGQSTSLLVNNGDAVSSDQGADVWLVSHDATGNPIYSTPWSGTSLTVYWGQGSTDCTIQGNVPAIEVVLLTGASVASAVTTHYVADPCSRGNNFTTASTVTAQLFPSINFNYQLTIPSVANGLVMRVIPLYTNSPIGISGSSTLPKQGTLISSVGFAGSNTIQRKLIYYQGYPTLPVELFTYVFFVNPN